MTDAPRYRTPRTLPGISSRLMTDYYGLPMRGLYFIENTLEGRPAAAPPADPVILVAGTFDPHLVY